MTTNPTPQGLPAKICVIPPEPFSEDELRQRWNAQADEWNSWDNLSPGEQLEWAQSCAIAADHAERVAWTQICSRAPIPQYDRQQIAALLKPGETIAATDPANAILAIAADCTG